MKSLIVLCLLSVVIALGPASLAHACPLCSGPSMTLSEQLAKSKAVVLASWDEGRKPSGKTFGDTTFSIVAIAQMPANEKLTKGSRFVMPRFRSGKPGDLWLVFGEQDNEGINWKSVMPGSQAAFKYISDAPSPKQQTAERLEYYLRFLESPDLTISNDAYGEFANAPWEEIVKLKEKLDREKLSRWVASPKTISTRLGLYGLLLGLCGNAGDAAMMKAKIVAAAGMVDVVGIDGVTCGYLLLTGEEGLDWIDKTKLKNKEAVGNDFYPGIQAVRFMWDYGLGRISKERLKQSMRSVLDRPELVELAIADLARWEDWSVHEKLTGLYGQPGYNEVPAKKAIVCFLIVAQKKNPELSTDLDKLRKQDPKFVKETEAFFRR